MTKACFVAADYPVQTFFGAAANCRCLIPRHWQIIVISAAVYDRETAGVPSCRMLTASLHWNWPRMRPLALSIRRRQVCQARCS